jgi:enoyl-CoA hydratase/carnithine racemase
MTYRNLLIEQEGPVAIVSLNRASRHNALSLELMRELETAALSFRDDVDTRVVIITGTGKHFSAGMDLKDPEQTHSIGLPVLAKQRRFHLGPRLIRALREMNQITIAAVNGSAMGGGACIASALDFRIGAEDCLVGFPESSLAIPLSWVSLPLCVHLVGPAKAKRWLISGEKLGAETLTRWGFLDETAPSEALLKQARELAAVYADRPPLVAQMIKRSVNMMVGSLDEAIMHMDTDQVLLAETTGDFQEGIRAFLEKCPPKFKGE